VHKAILGARSQFFEKAFTTEMSEKETGVINIKGFSKETISAILEYIYTGNCPNLQAMAATIFPAADQFMLSELKTLCLLHISENLSVKNVVETLKMADLHSENELRRKCLQLISNHRANIQFDQIKDLNHSNPDLFLEIISRTAGFKQ